MAKVYNIWLSVEKYDTKTGKSESVTSFVPLNVSLKLGTVKSFKNAVSKVLEINHKLKKIKRYKMMTTRELIQKAYQYLDEGIDDTVLEAQFKADLQNYLNTTPEDVKEQSLNIIEELLGSCELNLDEVEPETAKTYEKAENFLKRAKG